MKITINSHLSQKTKIPKFIKVVTGAIIYLPLKYSICSVFTSTNEHGNYSY